MPRCSRGLLVAAACCRRRILHHRADDRHARSRVLFAAQPALHHGPGRHALVRPCRVLRPRRVRRGALLQECRRCRWKLALVVAPLVGGLGALLFGWFCVRLSGVYLAMLTLAFAQIVWSIVFQWDELTGGSNGLIGVWPAAMARDKSRVLLSDAGALRCRRAARAPYPVRAVRLCPARRPRFAAACRRDRHRRAVRVQWMAFVIAGGDLRHCRRAVRFLERQHLAGDDLDWPLGRRARHGAARRHRYACRPDRRQRHIYWLQDSVARQTEYWRALLGLVILFLVLVFPQGIAGTIQSWSQRAWKRA